MIRRLRGRHLWMVGVMAALAGALLVLALLARPDRPLEPTLAEPLESPQP